MCKCHVATFQEYPFTKRLNMKQSKIWPHSKVDMNERCFTLGHRLRLMYESKIGLESWAMHQYYNNLCCYGWVLVYKISFAFSSFSSFLFFPFKFQLQIHARCITVSYSIDMDVMIWLISRFNGLKLLFLSEDSNDTL